METPRQIADRFRAELTAEGIELKPYQWRLRSGSVLRAAGFVEKRSRGRVRWSRPRSEFAAELRVRGVRPDGRLVDDGPFKTDQAAWEHLQRSIGRGIEARIDVVYAAQANKTARVVRAPGGHTHLAADLRRTDCDIPITPRWQNSGLAADCRWCQRLLTVLQPT